MITGIGPTIGSSVEGAIRSVAVALNRPTSSFVMYASSAQGRGGMSSTAIRCWRFAVRSITAPLTGYLNAINSVCEKRKNHRMLLIVTYLVVELLAEQPVDFLWVAHLEGDEAVA